MNDSQSNPNHDQDAIDMSVIADLRELGGEDDPGLLVELIELFLADAPQHIEEVERSLASGEIKKVERAAHTLKSSSANLGAKTLSAICKEIEDLARNEKKDQIPALLVRTTRSFAEVKTALRALTG